MAGEQRAVVGGILATHDVGLMRDDAIERCDLDLFDDATELSYKGGQRLLRRRLRLRPRRRFEEPEARFGADALLQSSRKVRPRPRIAHRIAGIVRRQGIGNQREVGERPPVHADRIERVRLQGDAAARDQPQCLHCAHQNLL